MTLSRGASTVRHGSYVTLSGVVRPNYPGSKVTIQRLIAGQWVRLTIGTLSSASSYSVRVRLKSVGTYTIRTTIGTQTDSFAGYSKPVAIRAN